MRNVDHATAGAAFRQHGQSIVPKQRFPRMEKNQNAPDQMAIEEQDRRSSLKRIRRDVGCSESDMPAGNRGTARCTGKETRSPAGWI